MIHGVDLSYANGTVDYSKVAAKVDFVYHRATYGTNNADDDGSCFVAAHDGCKKYGKPFGSYHFWLAGLDAATQAQHFLATAGGRFGDRAPMVDVEEGSGIEGWLDSVEARIDALGKTLNVIERAIGQPIIYTNEDTWNTYFGGTDAFSGHRLWAANYPQTPGQPAMPNGWTKWTVHQYSAQGTIDGITGPVDLDVLAGDLASIARI